MFFATAYQRDLYYRHARRYFQDAHAPPITVDKGSYISPPDSGMVHCYEYGSIVRLITSNRDYITGLIPHPYLYSEVMQQQKSTPRLGYPDFLPICDHPLPLSTAGRDKAPGQLPVVYCLRRYPDA